MKVKELIEKLSGCNPEAKVIVNDREWCDYFEITNVTEGFTDENLLTFEQTHGNRINIAAVNLSDV